MTITDAELNELERLLNAEDAPRGGYFQREKLRGVVSRLRAAEERADKYLNYVADLGGTIRELEKTRDALKTALKKVDVLLDSLDVKNKPWASAIIMAKREARAALGDTNDVPATSE